MDHSPSDVIVALATPPLMSAIGVIRVSGEGCFELVEKCFDKPLRDRKGNTLLHGYLVDGEKPVDEVVLSLFRAPASYTGEDTVEISCHGSVYLLQKAVKLLIKNGARQAERGEFSKRAFLNGKMDTVKAESVIDLIESTTEREAAVAVEHLRGGLSKEIEEIRQELLGISAQVMASIDYPDDEIEELLPENLMKTLRQQRARIGKLLSSFGTGRIIKNGLAVTIVGKPNAGKSSLMNRLTGHERSIVTEVEGTTRDVVEETVTVGGFKLKISDTAGIRETEDRIESIGVERAVDSLQKADLVIAAFDASRPLGEEDLRILDLLKEFKGKKLAVLNKSDLPDAGISLPPVFDRTLSFSAQKDPLEPLTEAILSLIGADLSLNDSEIITNERQYACLTRAAEALDKCLDDILLPPDVLEICIEDAAQALAVTLGKSVGEDVLETIFKRFCVGK